MHISWDGCVFDLLLLENWVREAVYDPTGTDFLYWHHVIDAIVTVGGDENDRRRWPDMKEIPGGELANKFQPAVAPNSRFKYAQNTRDKGDLNTVLQSVASRHNHRPMHQDGSRTLPNFDADLTERLALPRRQLIIWMHSGQNAAAETMLVSPFTGVKTDARHGPICTVMATPKIHGNVSGVYRLRFETWVSPTSKRERASLHKEKFKNGSPDNRAAILETPALLSNRWKMTQEFNHESYLSSYTVEGVAIFRMDVLKSVSVTADQLRRDFLHPIPSGFVRQPPTLHQSEAGDAIAYSFVDQEVMTNFPAGKKHGLISINIQQEFMYHNPTELSAL